MSAVGPTFFSSSGAVGDHIAGDGLTRLQTTFSGGSSADTSSYAIGSGSQTGGTLSDGKYEVTHIAGAAVFQGLGWTNAGLGRVVNTGHTFETFIKLTETIVNPANALQLMHSVDLANMNATVLYLQGWLGGMNALAPFAPTWYGPVDTIDAFTGAYHHFALVWDTSALLSVYLRGIRLATVAGTGDKGYALGVGSVGLGGTGSSAGSGVTFAFSGVRVRRAQMYSGAFFAPPLSPAAWGPP